MIFRFYILLSIILTLNFASYAQQSGVLIISGNTPAHITACGDNEVFQLQIYNPTPFNIQGVQFTLTLPAGINYQAGSVVGAAETNISNLNQPIFTISQINSQQFLSLSYQAKANCTVLAQSESGIPFQNNAVFNFNLYNVAFSETYQSTYYTIKQPNLSITSSTNTAFSANIGSVFTRCFTITNGGTGRLSELLFKDTHGIGFTVSSVNTGIWNSVNNVETIILNATHFASVGNGDNFLDPNESITLCETIQVNNCTGVASNIEVSWGCDNTNCQVFTTTANIVFPALTPNLLFTPSSSQSACFGMGVPNEQSLLIRNTGIGTARNIDLEIYQAVNNNIYNNLIRSFIELSSIQIKFGNGNYVSINPDSLTTVPNYSCFQGNQGLGRFWLKIDSLVSMDSIRIRWNVRSCCMQLCNDLSYINGWQFRGSFKNDCSISYAIPATWGKSNYVGARTFFEFNQGPISIANNQTETFNFLITQFGNAYPAGVGNHWRFKIIKSPCLVYAGNMHIVHHSGSPVWQPTSVLISGDTIIGIFPGNPPFNLTNAELIFDLTANCNNCNGGGISNLQIQSFIVPTTSCNCEALVNCFSAPVEVVCPQNCDGLNMTYFDVNRTNFDQPDNNNDGLPDAPPASINMSAVRKDRAMFGDTVLAIYAGKINTYSQSNWENLYAITRITGYGTAYSLIDAQFEVFRNNSFIPLYSTNAISYQQNDSVTTRRFIFDLSTSQINSTGNIPSNFNYLQNDSVVLKIRFRLTNNNTSTMVQCQFLNEFYTTAISNPFSIPQYGCNYLKDYITFVGYNIDGCCNDLIALNGCDTVSVAQSMRMRVGPSANIVGGNYFRSEFRNFSHTQQIQIIKPPGYRYISANFRQTRTAGTNGSNASPLYNVNPLNPLSDTLIFNVANLHSVNGGPIPVSDEGYTSTITVRYAPDCTNPPTINQNINYTGTFAPAPKLINSPTSLTTSANADQIAHMQPVLVLQSPAPTLLALDNTVTWQVNLSNNSNRNANNTWIAIPQSGNVNIIEVRNITTNQVINPVNGIYQLGQLTPNSTRQLAIKAAYTNCNADSILVTAGWNCNAYPQNISSIVCTSASIKLKLIPQQPLLNTLVYQTTNNSSLCDTAELLIDGVNMQLGTTYNLKLQVKLPPGVNYVNNSTTLKYPVNSNFAAFANPQLNNGVYEWNISQLNSLIQNDGIKGVLDTLKNKIQLKFKVITECNYTNGAVVEANYFGNSACNLATGNKVFFSSNFADSFDTSSYVTTIQLAGNYITSCGNPNNIKVSILNNGPQNFGNNDSISIIIPSGITYLNNSFSPIHNAPVIGNPVLGNQNGFNVISWKLPAGITIGDSTVFSFQITGNPDSLNCRVYPLFAHTSMQKEFFCTTTNSSCSSRKITGRDTLWLYSYKSFITIQNVSGYTLPGNNGEVAIVTTQLFNFGDSIIPPNNFTISFYSDNDANGQLSQGDVLLHHEIIYSIIPGGGDSTLINSVFNILPGAACNLIAVIDTSINNCACMPWQLAFSLPFKAAVNDTSLCSSVQGVQLQLGYNALANYQYSWSPATFLNNPQIANPDLIIPANSLTIDTLIYYVTVNRDGCMSHDTVSIIVYPYNNAHAGLDTAICNVPQLQLNAAPISAISSGMWSSLSPLNFSNVLSNTSTVSGFQNGVHMLFWEVSNAYCPSSMDTLMIHYFELPVVDAGVDTIICGQSSFNLNASVQPASSTFYWQNLLGNASITNPQNLNTTIANLANDSYSFVLYAQNGACPLVSDTVHIQNYLQPFVNAGTDTSMCANYQFTAQAVNPQFYTNINWSAQPIASISNANTINPTFSNLSEGTYQLIFMVDNASCYSIADTILLTIYDLPQANAGTDTSLCDASQIQLNANQPAGTSTGIWNLLSGPTNVSIVNNTLYNTNVSGLNYGTYSFVWTVSNGICPSSSDTVIVQNFEPINVTPLNIIQACDVTTLNLSAFPSPNGAWAWWEQVSGTTVQIADSTAYNTSVSGLTEGQYVFQWNISNGGVCTDKAVQQTVIIYHTPQVNAGSDISICIPANVNLNASPDLTTTSSWWSVLNSVNSYTISDSTDATAVFTPLDEAVYTLVWHVANGVCPTVSDTINVTTFNQPIAQTVSPISVCDSSTLILQANELSGSSIGYWYQSTGNNVAQIQNANFNQTIVSNLIPGNYTFYWVVSNGVCLSDSMPVYVSVSQKPKINLEVSNMEFCSGLCTDIQAIVVPYMNDSLKNYSFTDNKGASYLINSINHICPSQSGAYHFNIYVETQNGCVADTVFNNSIKVHPSPLADFSVNPDSAFIIHPVFSFYNLSANATYYEWNFGDNSSLVVNVQNPVHTYSDTGVYNVSLLVKNDFGCSDTALKIIKVKDEFAIYIPNAFTPNGDNINPTFGAKGVGIVEYEMLIYNRWGELIFTSENINTQWDGTYQGAESPQGVYVYMINVKSISGRTYNFTGHFTLIR